MQQAQDAEHGSVACRAQRTLARRASVIVIAVVAGIAASLSARGQDPFPAGPGRDTIAVVCTQCHALTHILDGEYDAAEWEFLLYDMIARGAPIYERELAVVRQYLIDNFATDAR